MATKAQALAVARRYGFELDPNVSGHFGFWWLATFDHPTCSLSGDCRSIHEEAPDAATLWKLCIERMEGEGPLLEPCADPLCEYHHEGEEP